MEGHELDQLAVEPRYDADVGGTESFCTLSDDVEDCELFWNEDLGPRYRMGCSNHHPPHNWPNWQAQARSRHLGGVNACFADGSVRFVRDSVALNIWEWMLSRNDGQAYDYDF